MHGVSINLLAKNVQSIMSDGREMELLETIDDNDWDVIFLSETWRKEKEEIWKTMKGHLFLGAGWEKGHRGVAIMIHCKHTRGFKKFQAINERLCAVDLEINRNMLRLISTYMPDASYEDAEVEAVYMQLDRLCDNAKQNHMHVILGGDMNAVVGARRPGEENAVGSYTAGSSNERGEWLKHWASLNEMALANTFFNPDINEQWSYVNGGVKRLIDFIITDQRFMDKFTAADTQDVISVGTDHRTVAATVIMENKVCKRRKKQSSDKIRKGWKPKDESEYKSMPVRASVRPKRLRMMIGS